MLELWSVDGLESQNLEFCHDFNVNLSYSVVSLFWTTFSLFGSLHVGMPFFRRNSAISDDLCLHQNVF